MKFSKALLIAILIIAGFFGLFVIYFAGQVSAVYDPIKTYQFGLTREELRGQLFRVIKTQPHWTIKLTDSTGTDKNDLNYYCDIVFMDETSEYKYNINYKKESSFWDSKVKLEINLIGAFDVGQKTGGYKTEDTDVNRLTDIFEKEIIKRLSENTSR
jgi:hypothetical protein